MIEVKVNEKTIEEPIKEAQTLDELVDFILNNHAKGEDVLTGINLDGHPVSEEQEARLLQTSIKDYKNIEFMLTDKLDLAFESLDSATKSLDVIEDKVFTIVNNYNENQKAQANEVFTQAIDLIDLFIQLMASVQQTLKPKISSK